MATYYRWRRSTVQPTYKTATGSIFAVANMTPGTPSFYVYYSDSFTVNNGTATLNNPSSMVVSPEDNFKSIDAKYSADSPTSSKIYDGASGATMWYYNTSDPPQKLVEGDSNQYINELYDFENTPGTFVEYVYSTSSSAYPNGGVSGSYYYDQRTTIESPTAPTGLTYPNPVVTASAAISWTAATSGTNYPVSQYEVSYSTNGTSWTVAGTTASTSYSFDIPAGTTSITFRVRAKDSNNKWGNYVTGTASQVILAPDLTVPQMVMQGQSATVSWTAVEGADSYTLQRKANTDADWTQVYSGAALTFSETVGTWTSVQYRVQAVFDSTPGGWATSAAIPVVSSSALVISGTDGNLGTVVNDIPYSISTDTGNQVTATITVNSAVIFSGNVGNSTSDTIPVLDLVNGEGTIVIEASVQASSGTVSAVRTWTYTKAAITFPNAGSVAQLTQQGSNIWPKTLAECVRLPGGRTLDEITGFPCQVYAGSYVGTGTYGSGNPNTLTFPFEPKAVFIVADIGDVSNSDSENATGTFYFFVRGAQNTGTFGPSQNTDFRWKIFTTWGANSISWYRTAGGSSGASGGEAQVQMNRSGTTYYYIAIG